jgi:RimJ/RimL family protein N-acetyltransferase
MTPEHAAPAVARTAKHVQLIELPASAIHALAAGDLAAANRCAPITLTQFFVDDAVWRRRSRQISEDPASAAWVTRAIWDVDSQLAVGRAGYHGPPDPAGMVEVGYAVDPLFRRRGFARAALEGLLGRASSESRVRTVRATIRPDNCASRLLVQQYGFVEVGEQWDDEDGLETIFEVSSRQFH